MARFFWLVEGNPRALCLVCWGVRVLRMRSQRMADAIYAEGKLFLKCFGALCKLSVGHKRHEFLMKPKCHAPWLTPKSLGLIPSYSGTS